MPHLPGSNGGVHGKKGRSGRKSAYGEYQDARWLIKVFFEDADQEALEEKIRSGRFSPRDRMLLCMLEGDTRLLAIAVQKLTPDKVEGMIDQNVTVKWAK